MELKPSLVNFINYLNNNTIDLGLLYSCLPFYSINPNEYKLSDRKIVILTNIPNGSIFNLNYGHESRGPITKPCMPNCVQIRLVHNNLPFTLAISPTNIHVNSKHLDLIDPILINLIESINHLIRQLSLIKQKVNPELIIRTTRWLLASTRGNLIYGADVHCTLRHPRTMPDGLDSYLTSFCLNQLAYRDDWFEYNQMMLRLVNYLNSDIHLSIVESITLYQAMARYNYRLDQPISLQKLAISANHQFGFFCSYDNTKDKRVTLKLRADPKECETPFKRDDKIIGHTISIGVHGDVRQTSPNVELAEIGYRQFAKLMAHIKANG